MKILYAIQGTGNGHLARAEDVVPVLKRHGDVDIFVSGAQADIALPYFVKYKSKGLSFYFGKNGGVDLVKTVRKNKSKDVFKEIRNFPVTKYDVVINDFEPISAWAARLQQIPCVSLSHQAALLSPKVPKPDEYDPVGSWILRNYAPCDANVGFHFEQYDSNIFSPVIRSRLRRLEKTLCDHYTVYLPAYDDQKLVPLLLKFPSVTWHVFSKHTSMKYRVGKLSVFPIDNTLFTESMASCKGVLCGAGFETPAEALYLRKKLLVIPMKNQHEQHYNAAALKLLGVPVMKKLKRKNLDVLRAWIENEHVVDVHYNDVAVAAVEKALSIVPCLA